MKGIFIHMRKLSILGFTLFVVLTVSAVPAVTWAHEGSHDTGTTASHEAMTAKEHAEQKAEEAREKAKAATAEKEHKKAEALRAQQAHKEQAARAKEDNISGNKRLAADKLELCERRAKTIATILGRSQTRAQKQIDLFATIATRTQAFYTKSGKAIANYDDLVAAVAAAKATAEARLAALQAATGFSCDSA